MFLFKTKKTEKTEKNESLKVNLDLEIITKMNQEFALSLDLNDTLKTALQVIIARINAQAANIFLINEKKKKFECIASLNQNYLDELTPSNSKIKNYYDENKSIYEVPEKRNFIQFNFQSNDDASNFLNNVKNLNRDQIIEYANKNNIKFNKFKKLSNLFKPFAAAAYSTSGHYFLGGGLLVDLFFGKSVNLAVSLTGEATNLVDVNGLILFNSILS